MFTLHLKLMLSICHPWPFFYFSPFALHFFSFSLSLFLFPTTSVSLLELSVWDPLTPTLFLGSNLYTLQPKLIFYPTYPNETQFSFPFPPSLGRMIFKSIHPPVHTSFFFFLCTMTDWLTECLYMYTYIKTNYILNTIKHRYCKTARLKNINFKLENIVHSIFDLIFFHLYESFYLSIFLLIYTYCCKS